MGTCYNKIEINAPVQKVWETINDFHDLSWAPGVVSSVSLVGEQKGTEVGAKRVLNNAFHETLTAFDSSNLTFSYSIDDGPGPVTSDAVTNYIGVVKLSPAGNGCLVEWSSSFESADEEAVSDFCNPIYMALLNDLKKTLS